MNYFEDTLFYYNFTLVTFCPKVLRLLDINRNNSLLDSREKITKFHFPFQQPLPVPAAATPRCLRRADSGMPHEELTPRSDSISTESSTSPPEALGSNHSESSSGIHSNASSDHNQLPPPPPPPNDSHITRRATSVADLVRPLREDQWKSFSLTRGVQPPNENGGGGFISHQKNHSVGGSYAPINQAYVQTTQSVFVNGAHMYAVDTVGYGEVAKPGGSHGQVLYVRAEPKYGYVKAQAEDGYGYAGAQSLYGYTGQHNGARVTYSPSTSTVYNSSPMDCSTPQPQPLYGYRPAPSGSTYSVKDSTGIPVILENQENTVVIRRKNTQSVVSDNAQPPPIEEEPFGRSTNMRMTSFTDHVNDLNSIQASSATLPHYPTQPVPNQPPQQQYSTMPLPVQPKPVPSPQPSSAGTSCVFPRQHSTIPTHHNGVRLFPAGQNPYVKRFQPNGIVEQKNRESFYSS